MIVRPQQRGSTLILVLWVAFGLVALGIYFGQSSSLELKSSDQRAAALEAEQAALGAARYAAYVLTNLDTPGVLSDLQTAPTYRYRASAVAVGDARFWFLGRNPDQVSSSLGRVTQPYFGLVDEASKLNLNTATVEMLQLLPRMTPELAAAIIDWRDDNDDVTQYGAEEETYQRLNPPYRCKNAPFESIEELTLVYGMTPEILAGEDTNRNGVLDPNEDDSDTSAPYDNRDGHLDPGLWEYVTVHSRDPMLRADGTARITLNGQGRQQLTSLLQEKFGNQRANQIVGRLGNPNQTPSSLLDFFIRSGMTADEFVQIESDITAGNGTDPQDGLVNVNTASETVLTCIPGIGTDMAPQLVSYRQSNPSRRNSVAWVVDILGNQRATQAGRYLTGRSAVYTADVCAVGHLGKGYRRTRFVLDTAEGGLRIVQRTDLSQLGWALGRQVWQQQQQQQFTQNTR